MPHFFERYGTEAQCAAALAAQRWPGGFSSSCCVVADHYLVGHSARKLYKCLACRNQSSLRAGPLMDSTKLRLRSWSLATYLISHAKARMFALALTSQQGTSYRTAWLVHQKLMRAMTQRDGELPLTGMIQLDDAYLGGERAAGTRTARAGRAAGRARGDMCAPLPSPN